MTKGGVLTRTVAAALLLAACGTASGAAPKTWVPKPSFTGDGGRAPGSPAQPSAPGGNPGNNPGQSPGRSPGSGQPGSGSAGPANPSASSDPVVAKHLTEPDALAVLPDNTALVGERTTGRIVRVQPKPGQPVTTVRTLTGLDTSGGGGLLDLALSPNYTEDSLVFALITTATDNRVVEFTLTGPVTAVLTGIPRGPSDNAGRIAFGNDNHLYVGTSDAGTPAAAADPASLAGKVLRVSDVGSPAGATAGSPVFTRGHHLVSGLCAIAGTNHLLEVEPLTSGGEVNLLIGGDDYGWPNRSNSSQGPVGLLPTGQTSPGGCAVQGSTIFVTSRDGKDLLYAGVTVKGNAVSVGKFTPVLQGKYGRLDTVVAATDGALWVTTANRDGHGKPIADDDRVLRLLPVPLSGTANSPV